MSFQTVLILTLTALTLGAQGLPRLDRVHGDRPERQSTPRRERIVARVVARLHEIRTRKLQESLGLTEEKAKAIADRWSQLDEGSFARRQHMGQLRAQMNEALMGPGSEADKNKQLQPIVAQLTGLRQQQQEARARFEQDIQGSLTPAQQGRFILLMDELQKSLQEAIREQRKER